MDKSKAEVKDVARYIINYCNDSNIPVSNLKLQKLLYFVQGVSFAAFGEACFTSEFEAWSFGPVMPEVYHEFKVFGSNSIPKVETYYDFTDPHDIVKTFDESVLDSNTKLLVELVVKMFKNYSSTKLVSMTHAQAPWADVYEPDQKSIKITNESIKKYFQNQYGSGN
ncbi:Panacea domain-containing protein [Holdemania sp. Marseille-P2844]|jgi:uncharacterized phage-associated protein|uniref:Panacea domain-containing protein n=1 Tax=Holdemania sp. Marseille-P2844 TaxID=1852366 RepID=UPI00093298D8|nr:type II toxin-antitoxin system antitoxin SocA domain-containing protein [Holdemania sp. Marseille-P2844]